MSIISLFIHIIISSNAKNKTYVLFIALHEIITAIRAIEIDIMGSKLYNVTEVPFNYVLVSTQKGLVYIFLYSWKVVHIITNLDVY